VAARAWLVRVVSVVTRAWVPVPAVAPVLVAVQASALGPMAD
jgi:hypothetical protein